MAHRVALIQSQSEMAHYSYADAAPLLAHLNYRVTLITAHDSDRLAAGLAGEYDAIILASNALNDKLIRQNFEAAETRSALRVFLKNGGGLLLLHQMGVANSGSPVLDICPDEIPKIRLIARGNAEPAAGGALELAPGTVRHTLLTYPNSIDAEELQRQALDFPALRGLYWHYFEDVSPAHWDSLVVDSAPAQSRSLVFATKQSSEIRVVVSSLALDWQRQRTLFENLVRYVVEDRHNTALLSAATHPSTSFSYLIASLRSRRFPFRHYLTGPDPAAELDELRRCIDNGVHATLLLAPYVQESELPEQLLQQASSAAFSMVGFE